MNTVEQLIADKLELEMGMEVYVDVFTHSELESLFKLGYSTPSIFSEELNGSIYYYTIDVAPEDSQKYSYVIKKRPLRQTHDVPRVFNDRLLSDFYIGEPDSFRTYNLSDNQWKIALIHLREDPFIAIPSPPPKFS